MLSKSQVLVAEREDSPEEKSAPRRLTTDSPKKDILQIAPDCLSPDYTFIAKKLRAIIKGTYVVKAEGDDEVNEQDEKEDKEPYAFSPEEIALLIKDKQERRAIDARVVVGNFAALISKLHRERIARVGVFPRRIQVAYKRADKNEEDGEEFEHWTSLDILLTEDRLKVFYFDTAGDWKNLTVLKRAVMLHPNAEITICDDVEDEGKQLAVQKDGESCSIFTVDNIFHMSKIPDLHNQVDSKRVQDPDYPNVYSLDPRYLPPVLVRNAQSNGFINSWIAFNQDRLHEPVNKKGHNLSQHVKSHSVFFPPNKKMVNAGIQHKQLKYASRLQRIKNRS